MPSLACPACGAIYRVPDSAIGRQLKCAKCAHQWRAEAGQAVAPFGKAVAAFAAPPGSAGGPLASPAPAAAAKPAAPAPPARPADDVLARPFDPASAATAPPPRVAQEGEAEPPGLGGPVTGPLRGGPSEGLSRAASRRPSRGGVALALAWIASLALLGGGLYALAAHRAAVAAAWPPFQRVVGWFGG